MCGNEQIKKLSLTKLPAWRCWMSEVFSMAEGNYGKIIVLEVRHDLVPHAHSEVQFGFWLGGGKCHSVVNDEKVFYNETQAVAINRYQSHDLAVSKDSEPVMMLMLYVNEEWFDNRFSEKGGPYIFCNAQLTCTREMRSKCWEMMQSILLISDEKNFSIEADLVHLLTLCIEGNSSASRKSNGSLRRKLIDFRLRLAIDHIQDNLTENELMQTLGKKVGVSRSRLYELFKNELNSSPKLIQNSMLLDMATKNMAHPENEMASLSKSLGFSSAANFSRFFRSHKGITPTSYRRKAAASNLRSMSQI
jgi:AraC-like DNA-binding protein